MNKLTVFLVTLIVLVGSFFILNSYIYQEKQADNEVSAMSEREVYLDQFEDRSIELAFDYPDGPDGYVIDDVSEFIGEESQGIELVKAYRIMNAKEKVELENSEVAREGPPAIQVRVFKNDQNQSASMWVDAHPVFSNIGLVLGEVDNDAVVDEANTVRYTTDGLYISDNVVVANGAFIYHFFGSYHEASSIIHQDFQAIIDSVRFIQGTDADTGNSYETDRKIACDQALTYMLFESSAQADTFLAECIAGEHPEVMTPALSKINVSVPTTNQTVSNPIELKGYAAGSWFFEATAPVVVVDWDGRIIGESYIEAQGEWMTEGEVPFYGTVQYSLPADSYSKSGTVIFQRANASGLPEHDAALEIPITFK